MTDKQSKCINFIEDILPSVKFKGGTNGHLAYEFIKEYLPKAQEEKRRQERAADEFMLGVLSQHPITVYSSKIDSRSSPPKVTEEINLRKSVRDGFDSAYPNGIRCADDIKKFGNLWDMVNLVY